MVLEGLRNAVTKFLKGGSTYKDSVEEFIKDLQRELIKSDVNIKLVKELSENIKKKALEEEPPSGISRKEWFIKIVYDELSNLFGGDTTPDVEPKKIPWIILLVGVQGSGKTTTAGKLASFYVKKGYKVGLVAADTYRPGAYEQLKMLSNLSGAMFYGDQNNNKAEEISINGVEYFKNKNADIIIIDTAGRHGYGNEKSLLDEMRNISNKVKPDEVILVLDSSIGQKAFDLAKQFHETTPIGSIIVTKLDGTAKGGGVLSAIAATGARVKFIGTGEKIDELELFNPSKFVSRLLGLGDLDALLEKIKSVQDNINIEKLQEDLAKGKITMRTLYAQLKSLRKMGPFSKILQMLPTSSLPVQIKNEQLKIGEEKVDKWLHIIESMTYEELDNPDIIDRKRMRRIAIGSGTSIEDVKDLIVYYKNLKAIMKRIKRDRGILKKLGMQNIED
ncbi:signal recognition particle GTPase [Caldisphaera lagunensis DSM 15908]|uniref:Signal recognition particle 54 kDa protein n=1 Tax=Caldisphaera lagunensis (strain DSM 15908 / JCM 11604 / ANMR 0165 / IC-154) TaxID=1056495 RepID=L0AA36_CALLD|nr:signal recognition particle protein Srp54 [Caldisphaera lagunensis]AFZ70721.1 signal recognition particle GTPase [Caldisphaera lagunensis DSM 15908]